MTFRIFFVAALFLSLTARAAVEYKLEPFTTTLLNAPVHAAYVPGTTDTVVIVEQAGRILEFKNGKLLTEPFLDIRDRVISGGEMGLLSVAFHPRYADNGRFFVNYTANKPTLTSFISEFKKGKEDEKPLLTFGQPYVNHNGGQIAFGPDGFLYIGTGDGGSAGDPHKNGQNLKSLLGKMLRIDVDKPTRERPYAIPADNPFATEGGRVEIFAWGLRNPWRFSFDRKTKELWTGDVGQNRFEEIHIIEKGKNYGWNIMEGNQCYEPRTNCNTKGLEPAIYAYPRSGGISITGGFVYRGKKIPSLEGKYVYSDYGSGKIWALNYDAQTKKVISNDVLVSTAKPVSSFGEEADGEILVLSHGGAVYRLAVATPAPAKK